MATKAQLSRRMYGIALKDLTSGQKSAVTKAFNKQDTTPATSSNSRTAYITVTVTRPGSITASIKVPKGTPAGKVLEMLNGFVVSEKETVQKMNGYVVDMDEAVNESSTWSVTTNVNGN